MGSKCQPMECTGLAALHHCQQIISAYKFKSQVSRDEVIRVFDSNGEQVDCYMPDEDYIVSVGSASHSSVFSGFVLKATVGIFINERGMNIPASHCATHSNAQPKASSVAKWTSDGATTTATFTALTFQSRDGLIRGGGSTRGTYSMAQSLSIDSCY